MNLLSIDPSMTCTGWAAWSVPDDWTLEPKYLTGFDSIKTDTSDCVAARLDKLRYELEQVLGFTLPDMIVYEAFPGCHYSGRGVKNIEKYIAAVERVNATCAKEIGYKNVIAVKATTWLATRKKQDTLDKVNLYFGLDLKKKDNDLADAIGLGMWFVERMRCHPIDYTFTG